MDPFEEFELKEHQKKVKHFVKFIDHLVRAPRIEDVEYIFGYCLDDAKPIFEESIAIVAARIL
jgi:hypothetical protein